MQIGHLRELVEDMRDAMALRTAVAAKPDMLPQDIVERLVIVRENPVRVFREFRGLSQVALSRKSGVRQTMLSEIEAGKKRGSVTTLKALADALDVDLDDLV